MKIWQRQLKNIRGQAALEFLVVVVVVFFFLLFYLSFTITLVASEYVDYATFMAARSYKSGHISAETQQIAARSVFDRYMEPLEGIIRSPNLTFINGPGNTQVEGVRATYEVDLFYLPPLFINNSGSIPSRITLTSESILGKDPSLDECLNFFTNFANRNGLNVGESFLINLMDDNGC